MQLSYKYHTFNIPMCVLRFLKRRMRYVRAAGGIVTDDSGDQLLILRNGRWDLPKGKVEAGETLLQAALREVEEETGIHCLNASMPECLIADATNTQTIKQSNNQAIKTYHIFNLYGGWHLKQTSWFPMHAAGRHPAGKPQNEEGIVAVEWVSPKEWRHRLTHSYGTLKTVAQRWTD
jgi:8-oxo-dGTP pyrophosphatase MutT (NUDIX family)